MVIGIDGNEANVKNRVGSGQYAFELLKQFARNKNHQFIIYIKDSPLRDLPKESGNFKYKIFGPKKLWTQLALPLKLTFGTRPKIFFSPTHYAPRFSPLPYAVTIFDLSYIYFPNFFKKGDLYQLVNWSKYSILKAKHIFAISNSTKDDIVKNYHVDPSRITVCYPGYDRKRFKSQLKPKIQKVKNKYQIVGDYILFVGTLQPRKNIERLIEAFASIVHSSQSIVDSKFNTVNRQPSTVNLSLVIAGKKGWMYDAIFQKVKNLKLEGKVIFTNYVADDDLPALISGAKVYVLPSLWEGFGIPVIEAQACGVPVVVSNVSSLPEIVGDSGILIDPENTESIARGIQSILNEERPRQALIQKGFANIKRFSWQKCARETLNVLEKVASKSNH